MQWAGMTDHMEQSGDILKKAYSRMELALLGIALVSALLFWSNIGFGFYKPYKGSFIVKWIPTLVLALAVVAALGPTITGVVVALTIPMVPRAARVVRASAMATREQPFVEAAEAIGCSGWRTVSRHIRPSALAPDIVVASAQVGWAIVVEASLGFLGLGVQPPTPSWGQMLDRATEAFLLNPWSAIFPGLAIAVTVFALNLFGDALRDILDPRLKGR